MSDENEEQYAVLYYEFNETWGPLGNERSIRLQVSPPFQDREQARQQLKQYQMRGSVGVLIKVLT